MKFSSVALTAFLTVFASLPGEAAANEDDKNGQKALRSSGHNTRSLHDNHHQNHHHNYHHSKHHEHHQHHDLHHHEGHHHDHSFAHHAKKTETYKKMKYHLEPNKLRNSEEEEGALAFDDRKKMLVENEKKESCEGPAVTKDELKVMLDKKKKIAAEDEKDTKLNIDFGFLSSKYSSSCSSEKKICVVQQHDDSTGICVDESSLFASDNAALDAAYYFDDVNMNDAIDVVDVEDHRDLQATPMDCNSYCASFRRPSVLESGYTMFGIVKACYYPDEETYYSYCPPDFANVPINCWDVSGMDKFSYAFSKLYYFNEPLSCWDTSKGTNFTGTFYQAMTFDQPIDNWVVTNAQVMKNMFLGASNFTQPLGKWKTSKVTTMAGMFYGANNLNDIKISRWDTKNVRDMSKMFAGAHYFNQDINSWMTSKVTNMSHLFYNAYAFNKPLKRWQTGNVENMTYAFYRASTFNQNINKWNTSKVKYMNSAFSNYYGYGDEAAFNQPLFGWDTSNVLDARSLFYNSTFNRPLYTWNLSKATRIDYMFSSDESFNQCLTSWASTVRPDVELTSIFRDTDCTDQDASADSPPWCQTVDEGCGLVQPTMSPTPVPGPCDQGLFDCKKFFRKKKNNKRTGRTCTSVKKFGQKVISLCPRQCRAQLCVKGCPDKPKKFKFRLVLATKPERIVEEYTCETVPVELCKNKDFKGFQVKQLCPQKCNNPNCLKP